MTEPSTGRLVFKIWAKRIGALIALVLIIVLGGRAVWNKYDPTWDSKKAVSKLKSLAANSSSLDLKPLAEATEPYFANRIPFLVKYHPKFSSIGKSSHKVYDVPNSSVYFLFKSSNGYLSVYIHFHSGRAAAFSVLHPPGLNDEARGLAKEIEDAFPDLAVHVEESSHPELKIRTDML